MVFNKKDLAKAFSPSKVKRVAKKRASLNPVKPSTSGSTTTPMQSESTSIKVIVRVRPHNEREMQDNCRTIIKIVDEMMLIFDPKEKENPFFYQGVIQRGRDLLKKQNKELQFIFDKVFDKTSTNRDVFEGSTKDLISNLLDGYNCSVFAYGATGAGKTHTMLGSMNDPGITYRTVAELFNQIEKQGEYRDFNLGVTYLEIYNENVQDLLHKSGPLHLRDDGRCGVIVAGLKIITIQSAEELLLLLAKGNKNRTQHPTDANEESSRSHAVFQVYINITNKLDGQVKQVKLSMIDLAGSERATATGCKGMRFKEGANINKSLLALGNCINNLADGAKHVTYRDSKLTRLLKDSLGGNCQTVMIANIAPSSFSYEDTYNTLRYANRAKKITTHIKKNIISCDMHVTAYKKVIEEQNKKIELLMQKLQAYENGSASTPSICKDSKPPEEPDKSITPISSKMIELLQKKKSLNEKVLSWESADKILCCRIQYKKAADERLHHLTAAVDPCSMEEQNASGKSRLNKSLHYFYKQRDSIRMQMEAAWEELCSVETELEQLDSQIKSKGLNKVYETVALQICELEKTRVQQQYEHTKKISNLQQCEMRSIYTMIKMLSGTLQNYYNMMRGYGTMTDNMKEEFRKLVKSLEGVRNIKWSDIDRIDEEEQFYSLTCLSVPELMNPLSSRVPIYSLHQSDSEQETNTAKDNLNATFDASCPTAETNENIHETTITLTQNTTVTIKDNDISEDSLSKPILLPENTKKRALSDKNHINGRISPKQAKKISPTQRGIVKTIGTPGKENKPSQRPRVMMNAKSMAILNKMKADKLKGGLSKDNLESDMSDAPLKAVREKERRGLLMAHPYQKPNGKNTTTPVRKTYNSSSRLPGLAKYDHILANHALRGELNLETSHASDKKKRLLRAS